MEIDDNRGTKNIKIPISVIILTYDEEKNIETCLRSIYSWAEKIFIVDAYSTDNTIEIAKKYTHSIYQHPFQTQAKQFNWALDNLPIYSEWIMRLDADESVTPELAKEFCKKLSTISLNIAGLYIKRRVYFMNRWIRYGGYYPTWLLRVWRRGTGRYEERRMDEHLIVSAKTSCLNHDITDNNRKSLHWWINKHNNYATREAIDILNSKYCFVKDLGIRSSLFNTQESQKRWLKIAVYNKMPLFLRAFLYFLYRYFIKLGFLDGKEGLIWHCLQGFWYRFLVDAKIYEIYKKAGTDRDKIKSFITAKYRADSNERSQIR